MTSYGKPFLDVTDDGERIIAIASDGINPPIRFPIELPVLLNILEETASIVRRRLREESPL